ncbi:unnamed protein product [Owenia fusiformis]|uniref:Inositol 2-dehydrogenase n=1 Tax=Owenia fusiformis TaxID=6347 RepID=A0A8S4N481_OWEFU|nr:unnamed protein product [Owenia fusiformis]
MNYRVDLMYVVDLEVERTKEVMSQYNQETVQVVSPSQAHIVYADKSVSAVVVCSPTYAHEEIVKDALKNEKAVFCEKPIAESEEGTASCYDEAKRAGKPLFCSFNRRYDPALQSIYREVKAGKIGQVQTIKTCARDCPLPPIAYLKTSGGIFHDCAVHDIDLVCWILEEYPCSVFAMAHAHVPEIAAMGDVDSVAIMMKFPSGAIATIDLSRNAKYGYDQRIEAFGDKGMIASENQQPDNVQFSGNDGKLSTPIQHSFPTRYRESYINALQHFLNVLQGKEELAITKTSTLKCNKVATACEESYKTGVSIQLNLNNGDL